MATVREFRSNLKAYLERIKAGEIIEVGGVSLCTHEGNTLSDKQYSEFIEKYSHPIEAHTIESIETKYYENCDKCKEAKELRKWVEDGADYKICISCALKAKLPWHKLEKL